MESLYQPALFAQKAKLFFLCPLHVSDLLSISSLCLLQVTRGESQEGCSSSLELSCSPVSASECEVSAAGVSHGTTDARSTRPHSDCCSPPSAGLCSSSEEAEDASTSSCVPAVQVVVEGPPPG